MLDIRRLAILREVKLRGTLAAAAASLGYSSSAISQQLALLQKEVGVTLLMKSGRRVELTPEAELLVRHTEAVLHQLEAMEDSIHSASRVIDQTVRISVFQSAVLGLMPQVISILSARHPSLRLTMGQREPEHALFDTWIRDFDLVVAEQYPQHAAPLYPDLDAVPLCQDALSLGVALGANVSSLADVREMAWVMEPVGAASRHWAEQQCRLAGFEPDVRYETADLQAHIRLIEAGHAVALLPGLVWGDRTPSVKLVTLPHDPRRTVFTSARSAAVNRPAIRACRTALADVVRELGYASPASTSTSTSTSSTTPSTLQV